MVQSKPVEAKILVDLEAAADRDGVCLETIDTGEWVEILWVARRDGSAKGSGARAIRRVFDYADEQRLPVHLCVLRGDDKPLVRYYRHLGFYVESKCSWQVNMKRDPAERG